MPRSLLHKEVQEINLEFLIMRENEYEELVWDNPQIEIEHDIMEAEIWEYDDVRLSTRIKNKLNCGCGK